MTEKNDAVVKGNLWRALARFCIALIVLFACYQFSMDSARTGASRFLSMLSIIQSSASPADMAVRITPNDPEAHYTRGLALVNAQRLDEAVVELQAAIRLRPHHYYQWMDLGVTLDRLGDQDGARNALQESIRLAPTFAQPRWQLGNLLYREGRYDEAFAELRLGGRSNPKLINGMLELAWVAANQDVGRLINLIQPASGRNHFTLARFLAKQGRGADAASQVREAGPPQDEDEHGLLYEAISELLAAGRFSEAFEVWKTSHPQSAAGKEQILNGDFLDAILQDEPGFGWQIPTLPNTAISIDPSGPAPGIRSLRIDFSGESPPAREIIHQLVLVVPNTRYSLSFSARTEQLITGGPPAVVILDGTQNPKILAQTNPVSAQTGNWVAYSADFSTPENSSAVIIRLQRLPCNQNPCPVFGKLWLSRFMLSKIATGNAANNFDRSPAGRP